MPNFGDIQRKNNQRTVQSVKALQEAQQNYIDRENKVNGFAGAASQIMPRFTPKNCAATFGSTGGGTCVGP